MHLNTRLVPTPKSRGGRKRARRGLRVVGLDDDLGPVRRRNGKAARTGPDGPDARKCGAIGGGRVKECKLQRVPTLYAKNVAELKIRNIVHLFSNLLLYDGGSAIRIH